MTHIGICFLYVGRDGLYTVYRGGNSPDTRPGDPEHVLKRTCTRWEGGEAIALMGARLEVLRELAEVALPTSCDRRRGGSLLPSCELSPLTTRIRLWQDVNTVHRYQPVVEQVVHVDEAYKPGFYRQMDDFVATCVLASKAPADGSALEDALAATRLVEEIQSRSRRY